MAIGYLSNIDLNNNQVKDFKIDNVTADPTGLAGEGQMIYRTDTNQMKFHTGSNTWVVFGTGSGSGTVTSVAATHAGDAFTAAIGNTATINPSVDITMNGASTDYINGLGNLIAFPSIPAAYAGWKLDGDTSGNVITVASGDTVDFVGKQGISCIASAGELSITLDDSGVTAGAYTSADITIDAQGRITAAASGGGGTMTSWTLAGDSGSTAIADGDTATISGGTYLTSADVSGTVTIDHDPTSRADTTNTASPGSAGTFTSIDSVSTNATGHVTAVNLKTVTMPTVPTSDNYSKWVLSDGTTTQDILSGNTVSVTPDATDGKEGITVLVGATDKLVIGLDLDLLDLQSSVDPANDELVFVNNNDKKNEKIVFQDVHLDQWGDAEADVDFGGNKLLDVANGSAATDGVNLGQVETLVAGQSLFKGAYDASSEPGSPAISGASNIANSVGDFYAVTVGGAFFTFTLEPGDFIFINEDIAANSNPAASKFTVVQSGQSIAGAGSTDGATTKGVAGFDSASFSASAAGWIQLKDNSVGGSYGSASETSTITLDKFGVATSASEQAIAITASQVTDFCTAVDTCVADNSLTALIGDGTAVSYTIDVSSLNTQDLMVQCMRNSSPFDTVYLETERTSASVLTLKTSVALTNNEVKVLVYKIT